MKEPSNPFRSSTQSVEAICPDCGNTWTLEPFGVDCALACSKILEARNEPPLSRSELGWCEPCGKARYENMALRAANDATQRVSERQADLRSRRTTQEDYPRHGSRDLD